MVLDVEAAVEAKKAKDSPKSPPPSPEGAFEGKTRTRVQKNGNACKLERDAAIELKTCADAT